MIRLFKQIVITSILVIAGVTSVLADIFPDYEYVNTITGQAPYRKTGRGMIVVDNDSIRAFQPFSASREAMERFADVVNSYNSLLPDTIAVYCMPVPSAAAYYTPDEASSISRPSHPAMLEMFSALNEEVIPVDLFPILGDHASEHIYLRTDHHWAPLGAYYAAEELARNAGVPFTPLSQFVMKTIPEFVGTMYKFSGDIRVKNCPEDFNYYVPLNENYTAYYIEYSLDRSRKHVIGEAPEKTGPLFVNTSVSSSYCTFGGGDSKIVKVKTDIHNGRRVLLIKDSFGNALTPFLLGSFEEVHVIDCRFFTKNAIQYILDNGITDVVFCNNLTFCGNKVTTDSLTEYITQQDRF
ncbi:MAG: DHHW family protein [Clostridium sp.]|nr:DHHW family protein [Prevotella sp.]MCM1429019.1 DHHW family protein [Clostridium sp.]MCM1475450.1 DHHW family protein [Muribaculaceae bacterium]